jgi:Flp pilus assembly pilin Flp
MPYGAVEDSHDERRLFFVNGLMTRLYLKVKEYRKGQTMTEYALILAAVAIVVWVTYELMGQDVSVLVNHVDTLLTTS